MEDVGKIIPFLGWKSAENGTDNVEDSIDYCRMRIIING